MITTFDTYLFNVFLFQQHPCRKHCYRWLLSSKTIQQLDRGQVICSTSDGQMWATVFTSRRLSNVPAASVAIPAGTGKKKRDRVSAQEYQTQKDSWLDQEAQFTRRHWSSSTTHVEGTEISLPLRVNVVKPQTKRRWIWNANHTRQRTCVFDPLVMQDLDWIWGNKLETVHSFK